MSTSARNLLQRVASCLRTLKLLQLADSALFLLDWAKHSRSNRRYRKNHPDFVPPPPHLAYDAYGHTNWQAYDEMGAETAIIISAIIRKHVSKKRPKICEWGCGPGRVIRHLGGLLLAQMPEIFATDYNAQTIQWCKHGIHGVRFSTNSLEPPLPFDDDFFDCVYAISVFTHLSEGMQRRWIDELFRITKPSGIVFFTTHGDLCSGSLLPEEKRLYDAGSIVVRGGIREGKKHFLSYHPPAYVGTRLLQGYALLEHIPCEDLSGVLPQDLWAATKGDLPPDRQTHGSRSSVLSRP